MTSQCTRHTRHSSHISRIVLASQQLNVFCGSRGDRFRRCVPCNTAPTYCIVKESVSGGAVQASQGRPWSPGDEALPGRDFARDKRAEGGVSNSSMQLPRLEPRSASLHW